MAQRKKKLMKRKKSSTHRDHELQSDDEEFEVAAGIKDDQDTSSRRLPRFPASSECVSDVELYTRELIRAQNKKKKKKSGGFQSMGETLNFAALHENPDMKSSDVFQTLLFSATLPKMIVDFARAGLTEPVLIRLDVDTKLSDQLKIFFPPFLHQNVVKPQEQTVVFVATKHHVEHLKELLMVEGFECAYIYSALDQTARNINIGRFVHRKAMVLLVTDVAARGIDIPLLDNVINYNFPSKAKLFLHRVVRVARAGRKGTTFSLVCTDEVPYLYDLHLFLGRLIQLALPEHTQGTANSTHIRKLKLGNNCTGTYLKNKIKRTKSHNKITKALNKIKMKTENIKMQILLIKGDIHTVSPNLMLILSTYRVVLHPSYLQKVFSLIIFIKERYSFKILSGKKPSSWRRAVGGAKD
uniref:DEAD (Asp-Glu-Ala-Asp) box polypeptide 54 n=1 Tax=Sinocyclocheilus grahami TaxID=75366 RepID=A0A672RI29_SINGR